MTNKLDELDLKIIHELRKDGRASLTELSERTGAPRQTVTNRLKQLVDGELVPVRGGLSIIKMGYKVSDIGLEIRGQSPRIEFEKYLRECPRVLDIFKIPGKANFHIRVWGEDDKTINSTIESFGDIQNVDIIYTYYLGTPIHGDIIIDLELNNRVEAPCGMVCDKCSRYHNMQCSGCPATLYYRNPLLKEKDAITGS